MDKKDVLNVYAFFRELLDMYEFDIYTEKSNNTEKMVFKLLDLQGANLGNIESDEFNNLAEVVDRLDTYHQDYIYRSLEERIDGGEVIDKRDYDATVVRFLNSNIICNVLSKITPNEFEYMKDYRKTCWQYEIESILQQEEQLYKDVCDSWFATVSNEMYLIDGEELVHFWIDEDADVNKKDINISNYKEYMNGSYNEYRYKTYKELYEGSVEEEVRNDLESFEVISNDDWDFYLSFNQVQKLNLGSYLKSYFPFINKYATKGSEFDKLIQNINFYNLMDFEETLHLFYETNEIVFDVDDFFSIKDEPFNIDILRLAEGLISFDDFCSEYNNSEIDVPDIAYVKTMEYLKEKDIDSFGSFGADSEDYKYRLSDLYKELLKNLDIPFLKIDTNVVSDSRISTNVYLTENNIAGLAVDRERNVEGLAEDMSCISRVYELEKVKNMEQEEDIELE